MYGYTMLLVVSTAVDKFFGFSRSRWFSKSFPFWFSKSWFWVSSFWFRAFWWLDDDWASDISFLQNFETAQPAQWHLEVLSCATLPVWGGNQAKRGHTRQLRGTLGTLFSSGEPCVVKRIQSKWHRRVVKIFSFFHSFSLSCSLSFAIVRLFVCLYNRQTASPPKKFDNAYEWGAVIRWPWSSQHDSTPAINLESNAYTERQTKKQ